MSVGISKQYLEHNVFLQLTEYADFYKDLSYSIMGWRKPGTIGAGNFDTYVYSSMQGTLESIKDILLKGRINDAYALLRKYYDSTIINIYSNLSLEDNFNFDNFIVKEINDWVNSKGVIPSFRKMSEYIIESPKLISITKLIYKNFKFKGSSFEILRQRCTDHMHYLYYHNMLFNDNEIYNQHRIVALNNFSIDLEDLFIQHLSYLFYLNDHYMMSSDYADYMDVGLIPEEGSQYFVAPFIQNIFDNVIKEKRPDIVLEIKSKTTMSLS